MTPDELDMDAVCAVVHRHRAHGELAGDLHPRIREAIVHSGLPLAALPQCHGGLELDPAQILRAIATISAIDGSTGWVTAIHVPAAAFLTLLPPDVVPEMVKWQWPPLIGGASLPAGTADTTPDGYLLNGTWPLVTGGADLSWGCMAARVPQPGGAPLVRWFFVPGSDLALHRDWDSLGLRGSGSHSVTVEGVTVPPEYVVSLVDGEPHVDAPLYRFPLYGLMAACIAQVAHGIARHAQDSFLAVSSEVSPRHGVGLLADQAGAQVTYAQASARLDAATVHLDRCVDQAWRAAQTTLPSAGTRAALRAAAGDLVQASVETCLRLYRAAGVAAVYRQNELEQCLRDVLVVGQHALVSTASSERVGRYLLTGTAARDL